MRLGIVAMRRPAGNDAQDDSAFVRNVALFVYTTGYACWLGFTLAALFETSGSLCPQWPTASVRSNLLPFVISEAGFTLVQLIATSCGSGACGDTTSYRDREGNIAFCCSPPGTRPRGFFQVLLLLFAREILLSCGACGLCTFFRLALWGGLLYGGVVEPRLYNGPSVCPPAIGEPERDGGGERCCRLSAPRGAVPRRGAVVYAG
jgi:hypothetical protein